LKPAKPSASISVGKIPANHLRTDVLPPPEGPMMQVICPIFRPQEKPVTPDEDTADLRKYRLFDHQISGLRGLVE
jgi:hypothetical protein